MQRISLFVKNNFGLLLALILATVLRFIWLDKVPTGITGDELLYFLTAKSIFISGSGLFGNWNPLSVLLFQYPKGELQAELSYFLALPSAFLPFSLANAKFITASLSVLTVIPIYLATKELFGKKAAIAASFVTAINPWLIFLGRTAYDSGPATLFYAVSFWILIKAKSRNILLSIPFLFLAFYSYIATKLIFLPFVSIVCFYSWLINGKKYKKEYLLISFISLLLVILFVFSLKSNPASRTSEIFLPNDPAISEQVNILRKNMIPNPLTQLLVNKFTVYNSMLTTKFLKSISFDFLFISGDQFYSIYTHGLLYLIDAFFILMGLVFAFARAKKQFLLVLTVLGLSILPHVFHTAKIGDFSPHLTLFFIFAIIFIGVGISEFINSFKQTKIVMIIIIVIYGFSLFTFLNVYFFQYPLNGASDFKVRELSYYIKLADQNQKVSVYTTRNGDLFKKYLMYNNLFNKQNANIIYKDFAANNFTLGDVSFNPCDDTINLKKGLVIVDATCGNYGLYSKYIANLSDGGPELRIYNDTVCRDFGLKQFPSGITLSDFAIEKLSKQDFCQTFITLY